MDPNSVNEPLPSLPEVYIKALEACRHGGGHRQITEIIQRDTALSGRVLTLARGAGAPGTKPVTSLDQALLRLGTEQISNLVLTASLQQLLLEMADGHWETLHGFWHDSLSSALLARVLATLTRYPVPETAFLAGMLHNSGRLLLLRREISGPRNMVDGDYPQLSAMLARHWMLDNNVVLALTRQADDAAQLTDADHLTRITAVAARLIAEESRGLQIARILFGLEEELTAEILRRIRLETLELAREMGIPSKARYDGPAATRRLTVATVRELLANDLIEHSSEGVSAEQIRRHVHEINNPLTVVRQYLSRLRTHLSDPAHARDIDIIEEELGRAAELLAELASSDDGRGNMGSRNPYGTALNDEVRALTKLLANGLFREQNVRCSLDLDEGDTDVAARASLIRQIILNLLRNAAESSAEGGVHIQVRSRAAVWQQNRQWVELVIEDNGPGIPDAVKYRLFEPVSTTKSGVHSGLGLSIVKQLMDEIGAVISCQSGPSGTVFRLLFPENKPTSDH